MREPQLNNSIRTPHAPDWAILRLLNRYRLVVVLALAAVFYLASDQEAIGTRASGLFEATLLFYFTATAIAGILAHRRWPSIITQFYLQNYVDILCIVSFIYASGGVQSGLGTLLLINIALLSQLTSTRHAMMFAAISTSLVLSSELFAGLLYGQWASDFERTALLGILMFVVAWLLTVPLRRLLDRDLTRPTKNRATLDAEEIATLNEEIIRELDSGVLVLNAHNQVVMINDMARAMIGAEFTELPAHLSRLCPELMTNLSAATGNPSAGVHSFKVSTTDHDILPRYSPLSTSGMLIRIDDHSAIRQQFQQLKMASLGRLSASIAHEIRNPLSAISHATQLLQESTNTDEFDQQLLAIAHNNTDRINRIIEDILQLSNRQKIRRDTLDLNHVLTDFCTRFEGESLREGSTIELNLDPGLIAVFDPLHLDQVLWNVCSNALLHNKHTDIAIEIRAFNETPSSTVIDIIDNGRGIADLDRQKLFEPFYSTHHEGCGLGLYIIRELCELNKAQLSCVDATDGAHFRVTLTNTQQMVA